MELNLISFNTQKASSLSVKPEVFDQPFNQALVHEVTVIYQNNARSGSSSQKTKAEVSGGGIKPWKQKGTGRARTGSIRNPQWKGGGKVFPNKQMDYTKKINRKMYRGALRSILSQLIRDERLVIVDNVTMKDKKTKTFVTALKKVAASNNVLIVDVAISAELASASNNLPKVEIVAPLKINPVNLLKYEKAILTESAVRKLEEWLA